MIRTKLFVIIYIKKNDEPYQILLKSAPCLSSSSETRRNQFHHFLQARRKEKSENGVIFIGHYLTWGHLQGSLPPRGISM